MPGCYCIAPPFSSLTAPSRTVTTLLHRFNAADSSTPYLLCIRTSHTTIVDIVGLYLTYYPTKRRHPSTQYDDPPPPFLLLPSPSSLLPFPAPAIDADPNPGPAERHHNAKMDKISRWSRPIQVQGRTATAEWAAGSIGVPSPSPSARACLGP
jgi:hypothetical protein